MKNNRVPLNNLSLDPRIIRGTIENCYRSYRSEENFLLFYIVYEFTTEWKRLNTPIRMQYSVIGNGK